MDTTSDLTLLPLEKLAELAYALQIDYEPPLQEGDRKKVIEEIMWVSDHRDEILSREEDIMRDRKRKRKRDGIMCDQEESVITGDNLLLLSDQQLIFLPFTHNGRKRYYCFTRSEAVEYLLEKKINPYTGEELSENELDYIQDELDSKAYPNIPVNSFLVEIEERLGGKKFQYNKPEYRDLIDRLVKIVEEKAGDFVKPGSLYDFASNLSTKNYNTFLRHDELRQVINNNTTRDNAATETLNHILNRYNLLKTSNDERASNFIFNIALAMEEFLYMIKNNLSYSELLEQKGEEAEGNIKELHWKPDFVKEEYHYNSNLAKRYYVNENNEMHGPYESYHIDGSIASTVNYVNGKKEGILRTKSRDGSLYAISNYINDVKEGISERYHKNGNIQEKMNYINGKKEGISELYYKSGELRSKTRYVNDTKNGLREEYYKNGDLKAEIEYINGKKNGKYNTYFIGEHPEIITTYVNDKIDGEYREYDNNGTLHIKGNYSNGMKIGSYEVFDEEGGLELLEEYDNQGNLLKRVSYAEEDNI